MINAPMIASVAVLAAAPIALGGRVLGSVGMGNPTCTCGSPIETTTSFYQAPFGNNYPPSAMFITLVPSLADDSYVLMDPLGPSSGTRTAQAPGGSPDASNSTGFFVDESTLTNNFFTAEGVPFGSTSPFGVPGVMIAQLTTDGSLSSCCGLWISIADEFTWWVPLNGDAVSNLKVQSRISRVAHNGMNVHEVWVLDVPAPGTAALLVAAPLAWRRRR